MNLKPEQRRFTSTPGFLVRADVEGGALSSAVGPLLLNEQRRDHMPKPAGTRHPDLPLAGMSAVLR